MATVNKDFRIKNGLVVEGSTATVNGSTVLTEASTEFLQDTTAAMFTNGTHTDITFTYNDSTGTIDAAVSSTPTFADKITFEGATPDSYETILQVTEPTQDNTITLPNATTTLVGTDTTNTLTYKTFDTAGTGNVLQINSNTVNSYTGSGSQVVLSNTPSITGAINLNGSTSGQTSIQASAVASGTITFPAVTGTVVTSADTGTVTNTMLAGSIANDKLVNDSVTINGYEITLGSSATYSTDNINEGTTNKYFTDERAQDAIGVLIANGTQTNITVTYDDANAALNFNATGGVASLSGTANEVEVTNVGTAYTIGLPNNITVAGNITINGTPTNATDAATKGYVDSVAEGLHVHASVVAATTANIDLSTDLEAGDVIDGVTLVAGDRVLVKNQNTASENGIYIASTTGAASRASDYNTAAEIDAGDFFYVTGGTTYDNTGWVQTNTVTTLGTDPIAFTQFSGAGTYVAGNGLTLTGNSFSINTGVTVDLNSIQTLTNKTLTSPTLTTPSISGLLVLDNNIVIEGTNDIHETTLVFTDPTQDNTITFQDASGTLAFTADITTAINGLTTSDIEEGTNLYYTAERVQDEINDTLSAGSGIQLTYTDNGGGDGSLQIANTGVLSITGTADQISATASTGAVILSLPQSIATTSTPTFGSLTLTNALTATAVTFANSQIGSATALAATSPTVIDTWSVAAYNSAKYVVQLKKNNDIQVIEVLVTIDGNNNVYVTEYAEVTSNTVLGTTDAEYSSGNVNLLVTAAATDTAVKVHKTLVEA